MPSAGDGDLIERHLYSGERRFDLSTIVFSPVMLTFHRVIREQPLLRPSTS